MTRKKVTKRLLAMAIAWTLYQYEQKSGEQKRARPLRGYHTHDIDVAKEIIEAIRADYAQAMHWFGRGQGSRPNFQVMKGQTVDSFAENQGWNTPTRNYFSSVVSTYIGWDSKGIAEKHQKEVAEVFDWFLIFNHPDLRDDE